MKIISLKNLLKAILVIVFATPFMVNAYTFDLVKCQADGQQNEKLIGWDVGSCKYNGQSLTPALVKRAGSKICVCSGGPYHSLSTVKINGQQYGAEYDGGPCRLLSDLASTSLEATVLALAHWAP